MDIVGPALHIEKKHRSLEHKHVWLSVSIDHCFAALLHLAKGDASMHIQEWLIVSVETQRNERRMATNWRCVSLSVETGWLGSQKKNNTLMSGFQLVMLHLVCDNNQIRAQRLATLGCLSVYLPVKNPQPSPTLSFPYWWPMRFNLHPSSAPGLIDPCISLSLVQRHAR